MRAGVPPSPAPAVFDEAVASLRATRVRPEVTLIELPAPGRLAPFTFALGADVAQGEVDLSSGRLVLLHDPAGHESWGGTMRLVAYVRAELEDEIASDPFLGGVGWSWLLEALDAHGASYTRAGGTVTRTASESFGAMAGQRATSEVEVRASWTPTRPDLSAHLTAWCDLLCYAGGLPPLSEDVTPMPPARRRPSR